MDPADVESYGRSAAALAGLAIDDEWWPGVLRHLAVMLTHATSVSSPLEEQDPAPVFRP